MIGINAAISSRASSIGFAVPINGAAAVLPQLRARGRVSRGYIGVALRDVDPDLEHSLKLGVQPRRAGAGRDRRFARRSCRPAAVRRRSCRSTMRTSVNDDQLIREISGRTPGSAARLKVVRDGRTQIVTLKLAERPARDSARRRAPNRRRRPNDRKTDDALTLGLVVRDLDRQTADRLELPKLLTGVLITRVEPLSSSFDGGIERGTVLLEINRQRVDSVAGSPPHLARRAYRRHPDALHLLARPRSASAQDGPGRGSVVTAAEPRKLATKTRSHEGFSVQKTLLRVFVPSWPTVSRLRLCSESVRRVLESALLHLV